MEPACIRHTDLPGTSKLFADFSYHFDRVAAFYRHDPHDPASFAAAAGHRLPGLAQGCFGGGTGRPERPQRQLAEARRTGHSRRGHRPAGGLVLRPGVHDLQGADGGPGGSRFVHARHPGRPHFLAGLRGSRFRRSQAMLHSFDPRGSRCASRVEAPEGASGRALSGGPFTPRPRAGRGVAPVAGGLPESENRSPGWLRRPTHLERR